MTFLISIVLATLFVGTLLTFLSGERARYVALLTSIAYLVEVAILLATFSWPGIPAFGDTESYAWIQLPWLKISYTVGIDGISLVFVLLTAFLQLVTVVYSWSEKKHPAAWFGLVLLTCLGCTGVFVALDILLF